MLCDQCKKRTATIFLTMIVDGDTEALNLCGGCGAAVGVGAGTGIPNIGGFMEQMQSARCHYCGGQPCTGDNGLMSGLPGDRTRNFICAPCKTEFLRFIQQEMETLKEMQNKGESVPKMPLLKQLVAIRKLRDEADAHMKKWAAGKGKNKPRNS